ncbi:Rha family transcriptional regulator [Weissella sagaensis]|uniref:Rha family transcriptional regulator n=1 Tax=Weissella sagaensis TaxID=2559928 RepID=A0ABW1RT78_9LACO|nr:Rha family transcriptional regulator [Weissella sagaensis]
MKNLVFIHDMKSEPYTTSDIVSQYSGVSRKRIRELITRHFNEFEQLGVLTFETSKPIAGSKGGRPHKIYHLTETHVTFLFSLLDNTPQVVKFNLLIAKAFKELKYKVKVQQQEIINKNILLERNRQINKDLGQVIHEYLPDNKYAYSNYHTLAYLTVTGFTPKKLREMYHVANAQEALTNEQLDEF